MSLTRPRQNRLRNSFRRCFHESKKDAFLDCLKIKLDRSKTVVDPNKMLDSLVLSITEAIQVTFPKQNLTVKQELSILNPWFDKELINQQKLCEKMKMKWVKSGHVVDSEDHKVYRKCRNKFTKMKRKARKTYLGKKADEANGDSEHMWKVIRTAMNQKPKPNITPDFIFVDKNDKNSKTEDKTEIANVMNRQLTGMGASLDAKLGQPETTFDQYLKFPNPNHDRLILHAVTESEISQLINELDTSKSTGYDEIPAKVIKWASSLITPLLTNLFNKCFLSGTYPDFLKIAKVKPIFKGGDKNDTNSYRPISILSQLNRIFERVLRDRLYDFIKDKLYKKQFGFRPRTPLSIQT